MKINNMIPLKRRIIFTSLRIALALFICISLANAQNQKVQLSGTGLTLKTAFKQIEQQTKLSIDYDAQAIDTSRPISTANKSMTISELMKELLRGTECSFTFEGSHILIKKLTSEKPNKIIRGTIVDESGVPIIGANVIQKGTSNGTITDANGKFTLNVPANAILIVSYIGYKGSEVSVGNKSSVSITLSEDTEVLDEVIVVGYGTMKKKDLSGAVGSIKGENLATRHTTQLSSALQGAIAGVTVTKSNGSADSQPSIRIRGITTIGDSSPLVIIDGIPGSMESVNANDVDNITVLKDAASASIYGSRAAAGVILITTKRAKENDLSLSYNYEYGWEKAITYPKYANTQQYIEMKNETKYNDNIKGGWYQTYTEDQINNWMNYNKTDPDHYANTSWDKLILYNSAPRQSHVFSISGGSKHTQTKASLNYDTVDGLYLGKSYERYMVRVNNDFKINNFLAATLDFNFRRSKSTNAIEDAFSLIFVNPTIPALFSDGRYGVGNSGNQNPYVTSQFGGKSKYWNNTIGGKASIELTPINGLKISGVVAPNYNFVKGKKFINELPYSSLDDPTTIIGHFVNHETSKLSESRNDYYDNTVQFITNYDKTIGKHSINVMLGYENYYYSYETLGASRDQYQLNDFPYLDAGPEILRDNSGSAYEYSYRSWIGRTMYNYDNKYLLQFNVRRDGSSRFNSNNRWGTFPSISAGWVVSEEKFAKKLNLDWLSFLKLRGSWGQLGNERIGNYPSLGLIDFFNTLFYQSGSATSTLTAAQTTYAISNISWETTESFNIGIDASLFNNRLKITGDWYKKNTKDMLLSLQIPSYVGYDNPKQNAGKMHTRGWEIDLGWNDQIGDLRYNISFNLSDYVSIMGNLAGTEFLGDQIKREGSQFNEFYGYKTDGLLLTQEDVDNAPKINNTGSIGDVKYVDISGPDGVPDGKISSEYDKVLLGGSLPRYMFGGNMGASYKGFDFSLAFQGVGKQNCIYPMPLYGLWDNNFSSVLVDNYWSSKNTDDKNAKVKYPRLTEISPNSTFSDFWLFNGRYMRLKNVTIGYTLPSYFTKAAYINRIRLYFSANDLFCLSKHPNGYDPESPTFSYPLTKTVLFGIHVDF